METLDEFIGKRVRTEILATRGEDGRWTVAHKIVQSRSKDLDNWENAQISSNVVSDDMDKALAEATLQLMAYLESVKGDLFNGEKATPEKKELQ